MPQSNHSVLIVEDNPLDAAQLLSIVNYFTSDITACTSAERGLNIFKEALLRNEPFKVLIADINLQEMSGLELIGQIRVLQKKEGVAISSMPIIVVSAQRPSEHILEECSACGGSYIEKPFSWEKLSEALDNTHLFEDHTEQRL